MDQIKKSHFFKHFKRTLILLLVLQTYGGKAQFDRYPQVKNTKEWKYYYEDSLGKPINNVLFDQAEPFMKGLAIVRKRVGDETHSALINSSGKILVPFAGHYIRNQANGFATVADSTGTKVYNRSGKLICSCKDCEVNFYEDIQRIGMQAQSYSYNHRESSMKTVSLLDHEGKKIFSLDGSSLQRLHNESTGYSRKREKELLPYFSIKLLRYDYNQPDLYTIITPTGETVLDSISNTNGREPLFVNDLLPVMRSGKAAVIDKNFSQVIPFSAGYTRLYELHGHPSKNAYTVEKNGRFGVITLKNEVLVPFNYPYPLGYTHGYDTYKMSNKTGDSLWTFSMALDTLEEPGYIRDGIKNKNEETFIFIDQKTQLKGIRQVRTRRIIAPALYSCLIPVSSDSLLFFKGDSAGFMNSKGKVFFKFPAPCFGVSPFKNGRALCVLQLPGGKVGAAKPGAAEELQTKYVWIDTKGKIINNAAFDWFAKFEKGKALVNNEGRYFMVDTLMRRVKVEQKYDYYSYFRQGYAIIGLNAKKFGLVDEKGKIVVPVIYDGIGSKAERDLVAEYRNIQDGIPYYSNTGKESVTNGFFYGPDIQDGVIIVTKGETEEEIVLFGSREPQKRVRKDISDSTSLWYNYDEELVIPEKDLDRMHVPLDGKEVVMIPFRQDELFGFVNKSTGDWMIKPAYEQVYAVYKEGAIVKINGSYGFVDTLGKLLFHGAENIIKEGDIYHCLSEVSNDKDIPKPHDRYIYNAYYNAQGKLLFEEKAHSLESFTDKDSLAFFRYGKTLTVRGKSGKVWKRARVTDAKALIGVYNNLLVYKSIINAKVHYSAYTVNNKQVFSIPLGFDRVEGPFKLSQNLYGFLAKGELYYCDAKGVQKSYGLERVHPEARVESFFRTKLLSVYDFRKKKYGVIDAQGKTLVPFKYSYVGGFKNGYALFCDTTEKFGLMDTLGKHVLYPLSSESAKLEYTLGKAFTFYEGLCPTREYCLLTRIDENGKEEFGIDPDSLCTTYFDTTGKEAIALPSSFHLGGFFSDGLAPVLNTEGNFGFINRKGELVIKPEYEAMMAGGYPIAYLVVPEFINGFAYMQSYKGYIDKNGKKYYAGKRMKDHFNFSH